MSPSCAARITPRRQREAKMVLAHAALLAALTAVANAAAERLVDARDGQAYRTIELGGLRWMAENLRFASPNSRCYEHMQDNCRTLGRLYPFGDALGACPAGW